MREARILGGALRINGHNPANSGVGAWCCHRTLRCRASNARARRRNGFGGHSIRHSWFILSSLAGHSAEPRYRPRTCLRYPGSGRKMANLFAISAVHETRRPQCIRSPHIKFLGRSQNGEGVRPRQRKILFRSVYYFQGSLPAHASAYPKRTNTGLLLPLLSTTNTTDAHFLASSASKRRCDSPLQNA